MPMPRASVLETDGVTRRFGGLAAVSGVNLSVYEGEILGLIGPNGAGKTTLFNLISGALPVTSGTIQLDGRDITRMNPFRRCRLGIARTFQTGRLFSSLSVYENVFIASLFGKGAGKSTYQAHLEAAALLDFVGLLSRRETNARGLTLAAQRRLEVARALATQPKLLLLDEVLAGLTPTEVVEGAKLIRAIRDRGIAILIVEHIMRAIMGLSDRVMVLHHGVQIAAGTPSEVSASKVVQEVYLGEDV
jgi:branched-chain amino acid transport system ATP-binding protein